MGGFKNPAPRCHVDVVCRLAIRSLNGSTWHLGTRYRMDSNPMKPIPLPKATAHRHKVWLPGALLVCAAVLSLAGARAQEAQQPGATLASPAAEALEVDASLFTVQSFDWFDSQRQRPVPAKLYLPAGKTAVGSGKLTGRLLARNRGSRDGYSYLGLVALPSRVWQPACAACGQRPSDLVGQSYGFCSPA